MVVLPSPEIHERIAGLYRTYSEVFKPFLAAVEAQRQVLPAEVLNEIRSFVDHVSRCYWEDATIESCTKNVERASGHLRRATLDCIKHSLIYLNDEVTRFERNYRRVDLSCVEHGRFYPEYSRRKNTAVKLVREAKTRETKVSEQEVFESYQNALNAYYDLQHFLESNHGNFLWARAKFTGKGVFKVILWVATAIASGVIALAITKLWDAWSI